MSIYQRFFEEGNNVEPRVAGLYDLGATIGRGHYAVVRSARHVFTGEKVAVKVIDKTKLDAHSREHLFQEVVCMKLVQHPNVVRLYEVIDTVNKLYLILELGDGGDLYDYIMKHEQGLSETLAKRYFKQIVTAISYCHNLHVVHRDLKPENVVFFEQLGVVKLTDFGFSYQFIPGKQLDTFCGSLAYSAPEILLGTKYDAPKVDIWSLGVILFMLVCGRLPFEEANDSETLSKIMDCKYQLPPHLSPECSSLISRLLIRDPAKRASLEEVLQNDWLKMSAEELPIGLFSVPLSSQEHLVLEDHMEILNKMAAGGLATVDDIQQALDCNEYSHISATYYLLAERKLKRNYIEEYKLLSAQANAIEQSLNLSQKTAAPPPPTHSPALPMSISASLAASGAEERLRRFSMILEDEEENADEIGPLECFAPHHHLPENFIIHEEALLNEEEEEFEAVASLACVRSELLSEHEKISEYSEAGDLHGLDFELPVRYFTRPNSRMDLSERAASDSSLNAAAGDAGRRSISSLVISSSRRPLRLRPLISVKSSPQLLKHIAEEEDSEWNSMATNGSSAVDEFAKSPASAMPPLSSRQAHPSDRKSVSSIYAKRSSMPRARSPPWAGRKMPTSSISANNSRPVSGINFFPTALACERKWRSSNPAAINFFPASRHTPNCFLRPATAISVAARERRRRSGPPSLSVLLGGAPQMNTNNPSSVSVHLNPLRGHFNFPIAAASSLSSSDNLDLPKLSAVATEGPHSQAHVCPENDHGRFSSSCQSAPNILDHLFIKPPGASDVCAPIREEEDENKTYSPTKDDIRDHQQQSPQLQPTTSKTSPPVSSGNRLSYIHQRAPNMRQQPLAGLTASNFSLASFASSLRESRHMMDVVRGTYELQMQSRRRTGLPRLTVGSSCEGLPPTTTSSFVRSLSLINQPGVSVSANASLRRPRVGVASPATRKLSASPPPRNATAPSATTFGEVRSISNGDATGGRYAASSASSNSSVPMVNFPPTTTITTHNSASLYSFHNSSTMPDGLASAHPPPAIPEEKTPTARRFFTLPTTACKLKPLCDDGRQCLDGRFGGGNFLRRRGRRRSKSDLRGGREGASAACCHIS